MNTDNLTRRGRKTRDALLDSARTVFEVRGFPDTRVEHITLAAGVAYGTFYRYFDSKEHIFRELADRLFDEIHRRRPADPALSPAERLIAANHAYYQAYRRNRKMMAIVEQVATINDEFRALRHEHRRVLVDRTSRSIARWQRDGLLSGALDPVLAARVLASMVDHTLYLWLIQGDDADEAALLDTLDRMCLAALGFAHR